jgi:DNA-binding NtrC family response regulator
MGQEERAGEAAVGSDRPVPGLLFIFHGTEPMLRAVPVPPDGLIIGRHLFGSDCIDERLSLRHAWVRYDRGRFEVTDLDSLNGTSVNLMAIDQLADVKPPAVLRTGNTLSVLLPDIRRFDGAKVATYTYGGREVSVGPTLAAVWAKVEEAAHSGDSLLVCGEKGTGKLLTAYTFHLAARARGKLVQARCAPLPLSELKPAMERRVFSNFHDDDGVLADADGGTLYLDEIAELGHAAQEKLLRAIMLGSRWTSSSAPPQPVDVRVVAASQRYVPSEVAAGRVLEKLYVRIGHPQVELPPLRHRFDDLSYLVAAEIRRQDAALKPHASLIEKLLVGHWPGNVEELLVETKRAARTAIEEGHTVVRGGLLSLGARAKYAIMGFPVMSPRVQPHLRNFEMPADFEARPVPPGRREEKVKAPPDGGAQPVSLPGEESIADALRSQDGNVTRAAYTLGIHRNQLRRYLAQHPGLTLMGDDDGEN